MPGEQTLTWLSLNDFSGGIQSEGNHANLAPFVPSPVGTLTPVDDIGQPCTYDCIALANGGIGPLPFQFGTANGGPEPEPDPGSRVSPQFWVGGLHVPQMVMFNDVTLGGAHLAVDYTTPFVNLNYIREIAGNRFRVFRMYRLDTFDNDNLVETFNTAGNEWYIPIPLIPVNQQGYGGFTQMADYRSNPGSPTVPGPPYVIAGICSPGAAGTLMRKYAQAANHNNWDNYLTMPDLIHLVPHQARLFVNGHSTTFHMGDQVILHNDDSFWTIPNTDTYDNGGATSGLSQSVVGSYGAMGAASSNELIIIRTSSNGGMSISSDLNDPVITEYATMQGTNGCIINGTWTPLGFVYAAMDGSVYAYGGGGRSQDLAPNLDAGFWSQDLRRDIGYSLPSNASYVNLSNIIPMAGQLAYNDNYVFLPCNWLYDITSQSWWRFKTPKDPLALSAAQENFTHQYFASSSIGSIYSCPPAWHLVGSSSEDHTLIARADINQDAPEIWRARTQPIPISKEQEINEVREMVVEIIGNEFNTVAIKILALPGGFTTTKTVTIPAGNPDGYPYVTRFAIVAGNIRGTHVALDITAGEEGGGAAPIVMRIDLGLGPAVDVIKE